MFQQHHNGQGQNCYFDHDHLEDLNAIWSWLQSDPHPPDMIELTNERFHSKF
jgi:hypothetical protein